MDERPKLLEEQQGDVKSVRCDAIHSTQYALWGSTFKQITLGGEIHYPSQAPHLSLILNPNGWQTCYTFQCIMVIYDLTL